MKKIILATGNKNKLKEVQEIFAGTEFTVSSTGMEGIVLSDPETGETFEENALIKAREGARKLPGAIVIADDSGLEIDFLGKAPGIHSARFMGHDTPYDKKNSALLEKLVGVPEKDRTARFVCAMAACFPDGTQILVRETMEGVIGEEARGENGFGYDPIFFLPEYGMSSAEISAEEKNRISHRGKALRKLKDELVHRS